MKGDKMTKRETIKKLNEIIARNKAFIEKYRCDTEISAELKEKLFREVEQEIAELEELIKHYDQSGKTEKRKSAAAAATEARSQRAKEKIQNAINLLKIEGKEITAYQVSKVSGVHYATVKKYLDTEEIRK
jgi:Fic family protein